MSTGQTGIDGSPVPTAVCGFEHAAACSCVDRVPECVNDLRQLVLEFSVEMLCVGEIFLLLSFRKVVEKWTEERCPLFHNHYYCDGDRTSSCLGAGFGGLIQTAVGNCGGLGSPLTNRCGFFW